MWTIFRKEFKEGAVLLIVSLAWLILTPWIMQILLPKIWDKDIMDITHALMFGLFVPVYLAILAAGMVTGENLSMLKGLPIAPWRIAAGKLLYLGMNFVIFASLSLPAILESPKWMEWQDLLGVWGWVFVTLALAVLTFTLTMVLKKSAYALFVAGMLIIGLFVKALMAGIRLGPAYLSDPLMIALTALAVLLPIPAGIHFFHRLLKSKPLIGRTVALCCFYPCLIGLFFLKEPGWNKAMVMCNVDTWIQVSDSKFLINDHKGENRHLYDLATGRLEEFLLLGKDEYVRQADFATQRLYFYNAKISKTEGENPLHLWSVLDFKTGKIEKLGFMPFSGVRIVDGFASWRYWKQERVFFGFADLKSGKRFQYDTADCLMAFKGTVGYLFEKQEKADKIWTFVDFASAQPKEVFRGDYKGSYWSETDYFYLYRDKTLLQWNPRTNAFREIGDYRFQYEFSESDLLLTKNKGSETTIVLWKDGRIADSITVPFEAAYSWAWNRPSGEKYLIVNCVNNEHPLKKGPNGAYGILRLAEGGHLKWTALPADLYSVNMIHGMNKILLSRGRLSKTENMNPDAYVWSLPHAYLYDLTTGKMRRL